MKNVNRLITWKSLPKIKGGRVTIVTHYILNQMNHINSPVVMATEALKVDVMAQETLKANGLRRLNANY